MFSKLGSLLFLVALTSARPKITPTQATPKFAQELFAEPSNPLNPPNPDATWGSLSVCPVNKFARGFIQWQDINETNPHGLTKLAFRCMDYDKNPEWYEWDRCNNDQLCPWIESGLEMNRSIELPHTDCQHPRRYVTGLRVIYGGPNLGVVRIEIFCDVPDWDSTPEGHRGDPKPHWQMRSTNTEFYRVWPGKTGELGWETSEWDVCPIGQAVCGVKTKVEPERDEKVGSGITRVMLQCCDFPSLIEESGSEQEN